MKGKLILSAGLFQAMLQRAPIRRRGEPFIIKAKAMVKMPRLWF